MSSFFLRLGDPAPRGRANFPGPCYARTNSGGDPLGGGVRGGGGAGGESGKLRRREGVEAFNTLPEAVAFFRQNLIALLKTDGFDSSRLALDRQRCWYQLLGGYWAEATPRGRYRYFKPDLDLVTNHQLTQEEIERDPALIVLYKKKMRAFVIAVWEDAYQRSLHLPEDRKKVGILPAGFFADTPQGKMNWDIVFRHVMEDPRYMGLKIDRRNRIIDPRLKPENARAFLCSQLGAEIDDTIDHLWRKVMAKYLLGGGLKTFYGESIVRALSDRGNYSWMFTYETPREGEIPESQHLHFTDFLIKNRWLDIGKRDARGWREVVHKITRHLGINVLDWAALTVDERLYPENHRRLLADLSQRLESEDRPFTRIFDALAAVGLSQCLAQPSVGNHPGRLLALIYPFAFSSFIKRPLEVTWFKMRNRAG
ncbi:MAG: hypothetical protein NT099_07905 [Candidatus Saganbacteria bacterium]|nr:hypothetical protein [Candidatus Saganbacteria bacterium]